jgi:hypothetical protein
MDKKNSNFLKNILINVFFVTLAELVERYNLKRQNMKK